MWIPLLIAIITLAAVLLRRSRWAGISLLVSRLTYCTVMPLSLLYFPMKAGWHLRPVQCEWTFDFRLAVYSLGNKQHMILMALFFLISYAQLPRSRWATAFSFAACFTMGFLVEIAEGATGIHHCRMRDLIPDMAGAVIGWLLIVIGRAVWSRLRRTKALTQTA